jgi:hypothetical protein
VQRPHGRARRIVSPQHVHETVDRDRCARVQGEHRDDAALPGTGQDRATVRAAHLDRPENPHLATCSPHTESR